jgi:hypothetical protein
VVNFVVGCSADEQAEVLANKAAVLLNIAAVHMAQQVRSCVVSKLAADLGCADGCVTAGRVPVNNCDVVWRFGTPMH